MKNGPGAQILHSFFQHILVLFQGSNITADVGHGVGILHAFDRRCGWRLSAPSPGAASCFRVPWVVGTGDPPRRQVVASHCRWLAGHLALVFFFFSFPESQIDGTWWKWVKNDDHLKVGFEHISFHISSVFWPVSLTHLNLWIYLGDLGGPGSKSGMPGHHKDRDGRPRHGLLEIMVGCQSWGSWDATSPKPRNFGIFEAFWRCFLPRKMIIQCIILIIIFLIPDFSHQFFPKKLNFCLFCQVIARPTVRGAVTFLPEDVLRSWARCGVVLWPRNDRTLETIEN